MGKKGEEEWKKLRHWKWSVSGMYVFTAYIRQPSLVVKNKKQKKHVILWIVWWFFCWSCLYSVMRNPVQVVQLGWLDFPVCGISASNGKPEQAFCEQVISKYQKIENEVFLEIARSFPLKVIEPAQTKGVWK